MLVKTQNQTFNLGEIVDGSLEFDLFAESITVLATTRTMETHVVSFVKQLPFRSQENGSNLITLDEIATHVNANGNPDLIEVQYEDAFHGMVYHYVLNKWTLHGITKGYA